MNINEARKQLKTLGYKLKTQSLSWGQHATITDMLGNSMPSIFFESPKEHTCLAYWQPAIDWMKTCGQVVNSNGEPIKGLKA